MYIKLVKSQLVKLVKRARIFFYFRVSMRGTLSMRVDLTRNFRPPVTYPAQAPLYIYFTTFLLHVLLYCMLTHYYTLIHILYYCMLTQPHSTSVVLGCDSRLTCSTLTYLLNSFTYSTT